MNQGAPDRDRAERQGQGVRTQPPAHLALLGQRRSDPPVQCAGLRRPERGRTERRESARDAS